MLEEGQNVGWNEEFTVWRPVDLVWVVSATHRLWDSRRNPSHLGFLLWMTTWRNPAHWNQSTRKEVCWLHHCLQWSKKNIARRGPAGGEWISALLGLSASRVQCCASLFRNHRTADLEGFLMHRRIYDMIPFCKMRHNGRCIYIWSSEHWGKCVEDTLQIIHTGCLGCVEMDCKLKSGGKRKGEECRKEMISQRGKLI